MKRSNYKGVILIVMMCFLINTSCKKDTGVSDKQVTYEETTIEPALCNDIKVVDGVLQFPGGLEFLQTIEALNNMSLEERAAWEASLGFESLESIKLRAQNEDDLLHKQYIEEFGYETALKMYNNDALPQMHADYTNFMIEDGILYDKKLKSGNKTIETRLENAPSFNVLNAYGIVAIGDQITQYTNEGYKAITNGDFGSIELLKNATISTDKIYIKNKKTTLKSSDPEYPGAVQNESFDWEVKDMVQGFDTWDSGLSCDEREISATLRLVNYGWKIESTNKVYQYVVFQINFTTKRRFVFTMKDDSREVDFTAYWNWRYLERYTPTSNWVVVYGGNEYNYGTKTYHFFTIDVNSQPLFPDTRMRGKHEYYNILVTIRDDKTGGDCKPDNFISFDLGNQTWDDEATLVIAFP